MLSINFKDRSNASSGPAMVLLQRNRSSQKSGLVKAASTVVVFLLAVDFVIVSFQTQAIVEMHHHDLLLRQENSRTSHPDIAWLLSFPNSGTTFTIQTVQALSSRTTGTNYETDFPNGTISKQDLPVVRPDLIYSPFISNLSLPLPPVVLTKTHCAGICDGCTVDTSLYDLDTFISGCCGGSMKVRGYRPTYSPTLSKRAVHLLRNPFNNIVARKHHWSHRQKFREQFKNEVISNFTNDRQGFLMWCQSPLINKWTIQKHPVLRQMADLLPRIPCYSEFMRLIHWHNNAVKMTSKLILPTLYIYYEDYESAFTNTVTDLMGFLELPVEGTPVTFVPGKSYLDYFEPEEVLNVELLFRRMALPQTWKLFERYFPQLNAQLWEGTGKKRRPPINLP